MNSATEDALKSYLTMTDPGYAILLDAPWGAGKTHFIKSVCGIEDEDNDKVRYASLNGVASEAAFRRALLKPNLAVGTLASIARGIGVATKTLQVADLSSLGTMGSDILEARLLKNLPETIIFDDLERTELTPQVLFGLINDFVEHQGKRVILVAHSEKHANTDIFNERKEKLVGRTLHMVADTDAALTSFLSKLPAGRGKDYFTNNLVPTKEVFEQAGHNNLRLLRNALRDCALVLDRVEEEFFKAEEPMNRFVQTYIALSMALGKGEIGRENIGKRGSDFSGLFGKFDKPVSPLRALVDRHKGTDIVVHSGAALPLQLGIQLFIDGHATDEALNTALRDTGQFTPQEANPLWRRFVKWRDTGVAELETMVAEAHKYLFEAKVIEAGPYLHIADNYLELAELGGVDMDCKTVVAKIVERIEQLQKDDAIPAADYGSQFGWKKMGGRFMFGGYSFKPNDDSATIILRMQKAQIEGFKASLPYTAEKLLQLFETDIDAFSDRLSYSDSGSSYHDTAVLHLLDKNRFAKAALGYLEKGGARELNNIIELISNRHSTGNGFDPELKWLSDVRAALISETATKSKIAQAQVKWFLDASWKFDPPSSPEEDGSTPPGP